MSEIESVKARYVLIDFENVQPTDIAVLKGRAYRVLIFIGAAQSSLPTDFVIAVHAMGAAVEYVKVSHTAPNAADFHIAYYLGSISAGVPAIFHVISKDKGFDPLMHHLKAKGIECRRFCSISDIPEIRRAALEETADSLRLVVTDLARRREAKPRSVKTLGSSIKHLLGPKGTEQAVHSLIGELERLNAIQVAEGKVSYPSTCTLWDNSPETGPSINFIEPAKLS